MNIEAKKIHPLRTCLLILLLLIVLIAAFPFIYDRVAGFDDYDDIEALASSNAEIAVEVEGGGIVCASADKACVYSYAAEQGIKEAAEEYISGLPFCSEDTVSFEKFGYSADGEALGVSIKAKLFGFLPVQLHADAELKLTVSEVRIRIKELKYGRFISLSAEKLAEDINIPELSDGFSVDISKYLAEYYPLDLYAKDNVLYFKSDIINQTVNKLEIPAPMLSALGNMLFGEDSDASRILNGDMSGIADAVKDPQALYDLLENLPAYLSDKIDLKR